MARKPFFSGNYGSALGSTANAANLIARAGATQGQMFANLGGQIGGMIQQYGLNKEKQGKLTDKIENRLKLDPSIAQRLTMSGDEEFDKKNATDMEKLTSGELGLKGLQRLDSAMATINEVDLLKQAEEDREMKKSAFQLSQLTQQLSNDNAKLRKEIAETEAAYQKDIIKKDLDNKQSQINYRNAATLSMLFKQNNLPATVSKEGEKRYSEIMNLFPKLDDTPIKVMTTGTLGTGIGAEEKEIPYSEYKENPNDYAPLVSDQVKGLQMRENALNEELSQLTLDALIPFTNNDTGVQGTTTVREMLEFQKQSKNNTPTKPQSMPLGEEDMMILDQPGTTIGVPQVPTFIR